MIMQYKHKIYEARRKLAHKLIHFQDWQLDWKKCFRIRGVARNIKVIFLDYFVVCREGYFKNPVDAGLFFYSLLTVLSLTLSPNGL